MLAEIPGNYRSLKNKFSLLIVTLYFNLIRMLELGITILKYYKRFIDAHAIATKS